MLKISEKNSTASEKVDDGKNGKKEFLGIFKGLFLKKETRNESTHENSINLGSNNKEMLEKEIWQVGEKINLIIKNIADYKLNASKLGLFETLDQKGFNANMEKSSLALKEIENDLNKAMDRYATISSTIDNIRASISSINYQIEMMKLKKDSNIDFKFQELRDEMVLSLGLKREDCLFMGELIDIKEEEKEWQGAIEKVIKNHVKTLIVPLKYFKMIQRWLDISDRNLDIVIKPFEFREKILDADKLRKNSFLKKLTYRDHPYIDFVQNFLLGFDLGCIENSNGTRLPQYSVNKIGEIRLKKSDYKKGLDFRINNKRIWMIGFSNKTRLGILYKDKYELIKRLSKTTKLKKTATSDLNLILDEKVLWEKIDSYKWEDLNLSMHRLKFNMLKLELERFENKKKQMSSSLLHPVRA